MTEEQKKKAAHLIDQIVYFLFAIIFVNAVGLWLPYLIDWYDNDKMSPVTYKALPSNAMTYFGGIAAVAIYDRVRKMVDAETHNYKKLELSAWMVVSCLLIFLIFKLLKQVKKNDVDAALYFSYIGITASYIIWWIANYKKFTSSPYGALGGQFPANK